MHSDSRPLTVQESAILSDHLRKSGVMILVSCLAMAVVAALLALLVTPKLSFPPLVVVGIALAVGLWSRRRVGRDLAAGVAAVFRTNVRGRRVTHARGYSQKWLELSRDCPLPWVEVGDIQYETFGPGSRVEVVYAPASKVVLGLRPAE